jgi:hypothetical protein
MEGQAMKRTNVKMNCAILMAGLMLTSSAVFAQSNSDLPMGEIRQACAKYLSTNASRNEIQKMEKKLKEQVETKISDANLDEDTAMRHIMLDWAAGNAKSLESRDPKIVKQACFYFIRFYDRGYDVPGQISSRLTPKSCRELIDWLETEAGKVQQLAAK